MKILKSVALGIAITLSSVVIAQALAPPAGSARVTHARGKDRPTTCQQLSGHNNVWQGSFRGSRRGETLLRERGYNRRVGGTFCFTSAAACQAWLYDMNSLNQGPIRSNHCRPLR